MPLIQQSAAAWNSTSAGTNITVTTIVSAYTCEVDSYADSWYGVMIPTLVSSGNLNKAAIQINSRTCNSASNWRKSTITHEMGHLLGLKDDPPILDDSSLMNHGRDRNSIYVPQPYDIMNVKYYYSI